MNEKATSGEGSSPRRAAEIALHEMGHTAFGLADEYEYYAGCGSGETDRNAYVGGEPVELNVTLDAGSATIKWKAWLTSPADALPTTTNANCAQCHGVVHTDPKALLTLDACDLTAPQTATSSRKVAVAPNASRSAGPRGSLRTTAESKA